MWNHRIAAPDVKGNLGMMSKHNDMATAICQVMSILQPYTQEPIACSYQYEGTEYLFPIHSTSPSLFLYMNLPGNVDMPSNLKTFLEDQQLP